MSAAFPVQGDVFEVKKERRNFGAGWVDTWFLTLNGNLASGTFFSETEAQAHCDKRNKEPRS